MVSYKDVPDLTIDKFKSLGDDLSCHRDGNIGPLRFPLNYLEPEGGSAGAIEDDKGNLYRLTGPRQNNFVP